MTSRFGLAQPPAYQHLLGARDDLPAAKPPSFRRPASFREKRSDMCDFVGAEMRFRLAAARLAAEYGPVPSRSRFEYASVWLDNGAPPPARLGLRVLRRVQQVIAEWRTRWLVRGFRRAAGLTDW